MRNDHIEILVGVENLSELQKDDQLVILSNHLVNSYVPNPEEAAQNGLVKRPMPTYFDIFGYPSNISPHLQQAYGSLAKRPRPDEPPMKSEYLLPAPVNMT